VPPHLRVGGKVRVNRAASSNRTCYRNIARRFDHIGRTKSQISPCCAICEQRNIDERRQGLGAKVAAKVRQLVPSETRDDSDGLVTAIGGGKVVKTDGRLHRYRVGAATWIIRGATMRHTAIVQPDDCNQDALQMRWNMHSAVESMMSVRLWVGLAVC
jgi:hypothetical protein